MILFVIVFAVFLTLKLTEVIDWSWWIIASPLLVAGGLAALGTVFAGVVGAFAFKKTLR